jgi:hypothetical protein
MSASRRGGRGSSGTVRSGSATSAGLCGVWYRGPWDTVKDDSGNGLKEVSLVSDKIAPAESADDRSAMDKLVDSLRASVLYQAADAYDEQDPQDYRRTNPGEFLRERADEILKGRM